MTRRVAFAVFLIVVLSVAIDAQVSSDRLLRAAEEAQKWITYSAG